MILTLTNSNQTATYWHAERFVLAVGNTIALPRDGVQIWCTGIGSVSSPIAYYMQPNSEDLKIDVTDLLRANTPATLYWCAVADDGTLGTTYSISMTYAGLINPSGVVIPYRSINSAMETLIMPPTFMLKPIASGALLKLEFYAENTYQASTGRIKIQPSGSVVELRSARSLQLPYATTSIEIWHLNDTLEKTFTLQALNCDKRYASVRWVSLSGVERCQTFEVIKAKQSTSNAFSLMPINNEYIDIKGREDGFVLHLDNLDAYDLWYYADVLQSSKVEVSLNGQTYNRVQITDKSVVLPDGDASTDGKLNINVNWKRYDAVAL